MTLYLILLSLSNPLAILMFFLISFTGSWYFRKLKLISLFLSFFPIVFLCGALFYVQNFDKTLSEKYCGQLNMEKDQCRAEVSMKFEELSFYLVLRSKDIYVKKLLLLKDEIKEDLSKKEDYEGSKYLVLSLINKRPCGSFKEIEHCVSYKELDSLFNHNKNVIYEQSKVFFNRDKL